MDYPQAIVSIIMLCIFVLFGVPIWWNTTKVYRASLPHDRITKLHSSSMKLKINLRIFLENFDNNKIDTTNLKDLLVHDNFQFEFDVMKLNLNTDLDKENFEAICQHMDTREKQMNTRELPDPSYDIVILNYSEKLNSVWYYCQSGTVFIMVTEEVKEIVQLLLKVLPLNDFGASQYPRRQIRQKSDISKSLPLSPGLKIVFTLAVANPLDYLPAWNIEEAVDMYVNPTLKKLEFLGPFQISSQILYFTDFKLTPNKGDNNTFYYLKSKLPLLINPLESRLNTYTSTDTSLNFVVYVPPKKHSPLYFKSKKSDKFLRTAFHSPRWGGIKIYNPPEGGNDTSLIIQNMDEIMQTFLVQILALNGIQFTEHVRLFPHNQFELLPKWIRNKLLISKTFEHLQSSISTLRSLAKLLDEIANIVIRDDVKDMIDKAVVNIEHSAKYTKTGDVQTAFQHAKRAFVFSEKAFYDPSLLALLYFPDDQKYAIYVPLFLPISLPIVLSFFKAVRWLRKKASCKDKVD